MAIPNGGLAQTSLTVEEMNERLRQNYWVAFEAQVERQRWRLVLRIGCGSLRIS